MRRGTARDIDLIERRAFIAYLVEHEVRTFDGWVSLSMDGQAVVARKIRGRNRWRLTGIDSVFQVDLVEENR